MLIIEAELSHLEYIAESLSNYFKKNNRLVGFEAYKTDYELMSRVVKDRLMTPDSHFKYFVMLGINAQPIGVINISYDNKQGEILALILNEEFDDGQHVELMLNQAFTFFKNHEISNVNIEINEQEKNLIEVFKKVGGKYLSSNYIVNL